jgi:hypothetical protein
MKLLLRLSVLLSLVSSCDNRRNLDNTGALTLAESQVESDRLNTDTTVIDFGKFQLDLIGLTGQIVQEPQISEYHQIISDTFFYEMPLGMSLENGLLLLNTVGSEEGVYNIYESLTYVLSLQDEGPHLDFREWNSQQSGYHKLNSKFKNKFRIYPIDHEKLSLNYGKVDYQGLKKHVRQLMKEQGVSRDWASVLDKVDSASIAQGLVGYPLSVGIGQRILKIEANIAGKQHVKWVVFTEPLGC